jgi:hypothetical protein
VPTGLRKWQGRWVTAAARVVVARATGKQRPLPRCAGAEKKKPPRLEELYELCDFGDLLYANSGVGRDNSFPY